MALPANATLGQQVSYVGLRVICAFGFLFLLLPTLIIMPISFSSGTFLNYPLPGLSLRWYEQVLQPHPWGFAFKNSMIVACATTVIATVLGTLAAYGLTMAQFRFKGLLVGFLISPLVVPLVITALAAYFALAKVGLLGTHIGLILAHTALATPFVVITVTATLQGFDHNMVRAAESLGANPINAFFSVTLPLILPGVLSGSVFAFVTSFDEIVVALFVAGPGQFTMPRQLFADLRDQLNPSIIAVATLLTVASICLMALIEILQRRKDTG
jgi:putative spermidine/putrescine transport system permease protein